MPAGFAGNIAVEFTKLKRSSAFWITLLGAAFVPLINFLKCLFRPDIFVKIYEKNGWAGYIDDNWSVAAAFLLVMYVILVTGLVTQIEFRNNTWKQVYASPRSVADIFFSKLIVILVLILLCFLLFNLFIVLSAWAVNLVRSGYGFFKQEIPLSNMLLVSGKLYLSIMAMIAIQYLLSLRFKNIIVPIGIGVGLLISGFVIRSWEHSNYYPYIYSILVYFKNPGLKAGTANSVLINSGIWFSAVLVFGLIYMSRKKERG